MPDPAALRIFQPVLVLALWTMLVLLYMFMSRLRARRQRTVDWHDFSYGESARVPVATGASGAAAGCWWSPASAISAPGSA